MKIEKWLNHFKKYYFTYRKGFYHLPYNSNSPQSMVDSLGSFPFVQHAKEKHCVSTHNPLFQGGFYYQKIEEGCWIVYAKIRYKANVAYDLVFEKDDAGGVLSDEDYYMLSLNNINNGLKLDKEICEKFIVFPHFSWTFFKPKVRNCDVNFKGASNKYITIYFNKTWLQKNLMPSKAFAECGLDRFISSRDTQYIIWSLPGSDAVLNQFTTFDKAMNIGEDVREMDVLNLKYCTLQLIFNFFKFCKDQHIVAQNVPIAYSERFSINRVEDHLRNHLFDKFPGIDFLSKKFGISETQLKVKFKQLYGKTLNQYFREAQMDLAKELLLENQLLIKEIAYKFGYESTGKFSAAFKKYQGVLPSELSEMEIIGAPASADREV